LNIRRDLHWLPVGHCHTHTQRLKSSGVKAGKSATVTDGVLVIDGVEVFSLSNGFIHRNDGV